MHAAAAIAQEARRRMVPMSPNYRDRIAQFFQQCRQWSGLALTLGDAGPGWCESWVDMLPVYFEPETGPAGSLTTVLSEQTANAAAATILDPGEDPMAVGYVVSIQRPAAGDRLVCRAELIETSRTKSLCEATVFARSGRDERLVSKSRITLAVV